MLETLTIHAPDFDPSLTWLGAAAPVSLRDLRGHVVILDFFTSCCVNCMHVAPLLHRLESRFEGQPVVVLGVHTGKFDHEQEPAVVQAAMDRMRIRHPVLVDEEMRTWHAFAVRSWPTLVVVRPDGTIAAVAPGEPDEASLHALITSELDRARARGHLAREPRSLHSAHPQTAAGFRFPAKVARSQAGLVAVSDTGNARVIVWDSLGALLTVVGPGLEVDAPLDEPQGLVFDGEDVLVIADARTHTIVEVSLAQKAARVVAGTGRMGTESLSFGATAACGTALRSPWDVAVFGDRLVVAMSGSHQVAVVDRAAGTVRALAGTGAESRLDGAGTAATFSQPNGLVRVNDDVLLIDSESSSLRAVHVETGATRTLIAGSLFTWGDADGNFGEAQLQHPTGIAYDGTHLLAICDTYNGKLKLADLRTGTIRTLVSGLHEPSGAAFLPGSRELLVADGNGHRVALVRLDGTLRPSPFAAPAVTARAVTSAVALEAPSDVVRFFDEVLHVSAHAAPGPVHLTVIVTAGGRHHFAPGAPYAVTVEVTRRSDLVIPSFTQARGVIPDSGSLAIDLSLAVSLSGMEPVASELVLRVQSMACGERDDAAVCEPFTGWWRVPLVIGANGSSSLVAQASSV